MGLLSRDNSEDESGEDTQEEEQPTQEDDDEYHYASMTTGVPLNKLELDTHNGVIYRRASRTEVAHRFDTAGTMISWAELDSFTARFKDTLNCTPQFNETGGTRADKYENYRIETIDNLIFTIVAAFDKDIFDARRTKFNLEATLVAWRFEGCESEDPDIDFPETREESKAMFQQAEQNS